MNHVGGCVSIYGSAENAKKRNQQGPEALRHLLAFKPVQWSLERKLVDDHILETEDHIGTVTKAKDDPNIPKDMAI